MSFGSRPDQTDWPLPTTFQPNPGCAGSTYMYECVRSVWARQRYLSPNGTASSVLRLPEKPHLRLSEKYLSLIPIVQLEAWSCFETVDPNENPILEGKDTCAKK